MYIADLHIHSRYSRATSRDCTPEYLDLWARRKGIQMVGSGDFTHPAWREELKEKLTPAEDGLYTLKEEYRIQDQTAADVPVPRFVITGEISSIYKKGGKVHKVHSLILLPGLEEAEILAKKLEVIGNIHSDGRPILGLDCHDLLEIVLELCPGAVYVPAHIWTPHFSLFGAFSGFDTVEECFEDLSPYIHAMETGLSSDPPMNWRISALDRFQLISNSDAHSPAKLGREANLLDAELSYPGLQRAIQEGKGLRGTIEFFPEEGKYHFDGHRKCNLCLSPAETEKFHRICPVCGRKITIGVSNRVEQLADREEGFVRADAKKFESLVPLQEVIGASLGYSAASAKVQKQYLDMLRSLGSEFDILRAVPLEEIRHTSGNLISEGISRLRQGKVDLFPGFDGEYGTVRLFQASEIENTDGQMNFFDLIGGQETAAAAEAGTISDGAGWQDAEKNAVRSGSETAKDTGMEKPAEAVKGDPQAEKAAGPALNQEQELAVKAQDRRIAVIAGPGTGKTKTLIAHICYLLETRKVKPSEITAVTFTNQAAGEMKERLKNQLGRKSRLGNLQIGTFHAICLTFLKEQGLEFTLADESECLELAGAAVQEFQMQLSAKRFLDLISMQKSGVESGERLQEEAAAWYQNGLREKKLMDFDDLLLETLKLLEAGNAADGWEKRFSYLLVDEFQDSNPLQYALMKAWNEKGRELFVIGDPDQSIYGFRGADAACFLRLQKEFQTLSVIELLDNYRSTPQILAASLEVISKNPGKKRDLRANCEDGVPVRLAAAGSELGEAIFVAKEINRQAGGIGMLEAHELSGSLDDRKVRGFDEIAVLYRTHRQADLLEKCLKKEGIPYVIAGRDAFLQEEAVRGSISFFRYLEGQENIQAKEQCLRSFWNSEKNPLSEAVFEQAADRYGPLFRKKKPQKVLELWMEEMGLTENQGMKKLTGMSVFYKSMAEFLEAISLGVESDLKRCGGRQYTSGAVTLMTLHGSKGLEFPVTIIYGARKGTIPFESEKHPTDPEEERRLFYVGMTRAREELILTSSGEESGFLTGIPEGVLKREKADRRREGYHQMDLFEL